MFVGMLDEQYQDDFLDAANYEDTVCETRDQIELWHCTQSDVLWKRRCRRTRGDGLECKNDGGVDKDFTRLA